MFVATRRVSPQDRRLARNPLKEAPAPRTGTGQCRQSVAGRQLCGRALAESVERNVAQPELEWTDAVCSDMLTVAPRQSVARLVREPDPTALSRYLCWHVSWHE